VCVLADRGQISRHGAAMQAGGYTTGRGSTPGRGPYYIQEAALQEGGSSSGRGQQERGRVAAFVLDNDR